MKQWQVKYYLGDMLHTYVVDAVNEFEATLKVLNRIPVTSRNLFRTLSVTDIRDKIAEKQRKRNKPYQNAYDNLSSIRSTFDRDSLEYKYLTDTLNEIRKQIV